MPKRAANAKEAEPGASVWPPVLTKGEPVAGQGPKRGDARDDQAD